MAEVSPTEAINSLIRRAASLSGQPLNEAATRLLFINEVLAYVLDWPIEEFNPEEYVKAWAPTDTKSREWLDYHVHKGETIRMVVEAKRAGKTFQLPSSKKVRKLPLKQLREHHGKILSDAISQAQKYCVGVGTQAFVVTNGTQWIASLAWAHNINAEDLQAIVYYDLDDISTNLQEFVDYLSPGGIADQNLMSTAISGRSLVPAFAKRLNESLSPGAPTGKNYLVAPLTVLMGICFGDLTSADHAEMLERCYVSSEATDEHLKRLESFVGYTLPHDLEPTATKLRRTDDSSAPFGDSERRGLGASLLVIGRAGSGKSTFLAITRRRLSAHHKDNSRVLLHVDLEPRTQTHAEAFNHDRLVDEVCADILVQADETYVELSPFEHNLLREIFAGEIRRMRASLPVSLRDTAEEDVRADSLIQDHLKKPANHLKAYLGYLDKRDLTATVLLDNVDRGTPEFEKVVFQLAQTLARNTNATIVTSLRETTYESGKTGGFLDVGRHTVLTISPPPFVEVARRRFEYAKKQLRTDGRLARRFERALAGAPSDRVLDFADILSEMVLGEGRGIQECIQALAGTNVRRALEFLEDFAVSPNTELDRLFREFRHGEKHQRADVGAPLEAFLRSVMRMGSLRYSEGLSKIINIFQVATMVVVSHFTALRILQLLSWQARQPGGTADMAVKSVTERLGAIGHASGHVASTLDRLGRYGLINSLSKPEPPWRATDTVRLGAAGRYYLDVLIFNREYIRGLTDDTIVYDVDVFSSLELMHRDQNRTWLERYEEKTRTLLIYLARRERNELNRLGAPGKRPAWLSPLVEAIGQRFFGGAFLQGLSRK
ncbi:hypothetical protein [Sorangium sp. So ce362]|uniref:hypothetical protein n=1 Tax=Sorangium sp. So ce362 TaxID=3133303 RepID=UPI003F646EE5